MVARFRPLEVLEVVEGIMHTGFLSVRETGGARCDSDHRCCLSGLQDPVDGINPKG